MPKRDKILIVDDDRSIRELLEILLKNEGLTVTSAAGAEEGLAQAKATEFDVVISDLKMPNMSGIEFLRELLETGLIRRRRGEVGTQFILLTAHAEAEAAVQALKMGAFDYILKDQNWTEELKFVVHNALENRRLREENTYLKREFKKVHGMGNLIGKSKKMQELFKMIEVVSATNSTVLITGESGTGKELVAKAIHLNSPRAEEAFVSVNCGAFTETLLESELFGYVKGSFTGATANRKGLFDAADQGTIFLDEIGEMSPAMQVKLLRVLQERKVRPVGAHEETEIDTRVIAATNRDLSAMVKDGTFREDLFYRVSVIPMELPSLHERGADIAELTEHFIKKYCAQTGRSISISPQALRLLEAYSWPGNVRELEHTIERAVALEKTDTIQPERLPDQVTKYDQARISSELELPSDGIDLTAHLDQLEKTYILEALRRTDGNQT